MATLIWALFGASFVHAVPKVDNSTGRQIELQVPFSLNNLPLGTVGIRIEADGELSVLSESFLLLTEERLSSELVLGLRDSEVDGLLSFSAIEISGIKTAFDMGSLSASLTVPLELLASQAVSIGSNTNVNSGGAPKELPANFSAFTNLRFAATHSDSSDVDSTEEFFVGIDGAMRYRLPVLQFSFDITQGDAVEHLVERRYTRAVVDLPERHMRVSVGDVLVPGSLFQLSSEALGVVISRDQRRSGNQNFVRGARREFTLKTKSVVNVFVDGVLLTELELEAGTYDLTDIPLTQGSNDIRLEIENRNGFQESIDFSVVVDAELQPLGEFDWLLGMGIDRQSNLGDGPEYDTDAYFFNAVGRLGLSHTKTLDSSLLIRNDRTTGTLGLSLGTEFGSVLLDAGARAGSGTVGWAAAARYRNYSNDSPSKTNIAAGIEYRSDSFEGFDSISGDDFSANTSGLEIDAPNTVFEEEQFSVTGESLSTFLDVSRRLTSKFSGGLSVSYSTDGGGVGDFVYGARVRGRTTILPALAWSLSLRRRDAEESSETTVALSLSYRFGRVSTATRTELDSGLFETLVSTREGSGRVGGYAAQVRVRNLPDVESLATLRADYTANRYIAEFSYRERENTETNVSRTALTSFRLQSSLVFAGGSFGVGRPVESSFAIVKTHSSLAGRELRVRPNRHSESAQNGWLGGAVLPDAGYLGSQEIGIDVPELPLGYDLGAGVFFVSPPLNAGYNLTVGSAATITVIGTLITEQDGEPVSLISGRAVPVNDKATAVEFFTNRTGRFALSGIAPGDYLLELDTTPEKQILLTIPETGETLYRINEVIVP